jgi:Phage integrase, N-terminal SAM-like domain
VIVAYAEKRGNQWRARWRSPDGTLESKPGFTSRKDAENYGRDQEAAIRTNTYVDPRAGRLTLTDWVNRWFPALDLEPTTLANYRYLIEVHILPAFGDRPLAVADRRGDQHLGTGDRRGRLLVTYGARREVHAGYSSRRRDSTAPAGQPRAAQTGQGA